MRLRQKQNGYALLIVLIAVAILLILYGIQMKTVFVPEGVPGQQSGIEQRPWLLQDMLTPESEDIKLPRSPKPELTQGFQLNVDVKHKDGDRGKAAIQFDTNGRDRAAWKTKYVQNEQVYAITARMEGNINVKQTYEDKDGNKDKSRLFFIAKGPYTKQTIDPPTATGPEEGTAWLIGWLKPDKSANGYITITTDEKWSAVYEWTSLPTEK